MKNFIIQDKEAGNLIESGFISYEQALDKLKQFELEDLNNESYSLDFYEIIEKN